MNHLEFPKVKNGRVTDCTFDEQGNVADLWVTLDSGQTSVDFEEKFNIVIGGRIHLTTKVDTVAK